MQTYDENGDVAGNDGSPVVGGGRLADKHTVEDEIPQTKLDSLLCNDEGIMGLVARSSVRNSNNHVSSSNELSSSSSMSWTVGLRGRSVLAVERGAATARGAEAAGAATRWLAMSGWRKEE